MQKEILYKELRELYNQLLNEIIDLAKQYNFSNPLEIANLFYYLIENNYFSNSNQQLEHKNYIFDDTSFRGINIVYNGGVCRHKSTLLNDLFEKMNIESTVLAGYLTNFLYITNSTSKKITDLSVAVELNKKLAIGGASEKYFEIIKKKKMAYKIIVRDDKYFTENIKKFPNHMIVLAGDTYKYFIDPEIKTFYYMPSDQKITINNLHGTHFFIFPPCKNFMIDLYEEYRKEDFDLDTKYCELISRKSREEKKDNKEIYHIINMLRYNRGPLEAFRTQSQQCINDINAKCRNLKLQQ